MPNLDKSIVPKTWPNELATSVRALNERKMKLLGDMSPKDLLFGPTASSRHPTEIDLSVRILLIEALRSEASEAFVREQARRQSACKTWNVFEPKLGDLVMIYDGAGDRSFDRYRMETASSVAGALPSNGSQTTIRKSRDVGRKEARRVDSLGDDEAVEDERGGGGCRKGERNIGLNKINGAKTTPGAMDPTSHKRH